MAFDFDAAVGLKPSTTATAAPVESAKVGFDFDAAVGIKPPEVGGLRAAAKQFVGSTIGGVGQLAADFIPGVGQDNAALQKGREIIAAQPSRFIAEMALDKGTAREDPREKLKALRAEFALKAAITEQAAQAASKE